MAKRSKMSSQLKCVLRQMHREAATPEEIKQLARRCAVRDRGKKISGKKHCSPKQLEKIPQICIKE